jgi:MinD-like ATPase involved in chromosome partitioning or flagellar assembly
VIVDVQATPAVALVFSPDVWVESLHRFLSDHGGARVRQLVVDPAVLDDEDFDVLVVGDRWPSLSVSLVGRLRSRGARVLGVFDPTEPAGKEHLLGVGVDDVVPSDAPPGEICETIARLADELRIVRGAPSSGVGSGPGGLVDPSRRQPVLVSGAPGSGATEVALGLSVQLAGHGPTLLVDARADGAATRIRLGLPLEPNLRTAVDELAYTGAPLDCALTLARSGLQVISGFPNEAAAGQVTPREVLDVVEALAPQVAHLVVLADGPVRDALTPAATLVAVCSPNPLGVARTTRMLGAVPIGTEPRIVVVNRAPGDRFRVAELRRELGALPGVAAVCVLPEDRRVTTAAWEGLVVGAGPFTQGLRWVVAALGAGARPRRRVRIRRTVAR